jgi:hypothetical protein
VIRILVIIISSKTMSVGKWVACPEAFRQLSVAHKRSNSPEEIDDQAVPFACQSAGNRTIVKLAIPADQPNPRLHLSLFIGTWSNKDKSICSEGSTSVGIPCSFSCFRKLFFNGQKGALLPYSNSALWS